MKAAAWFLLALFALGGCGDTASSDKGLPAPTAKQETPKPEPKKDEPVTKTVVTNSSPRLFDLDKLDTVKLKGTGPELTIWVMDTEAKHAEGMMYLKPNEVKDDQGMLFVFPDSAPRSFWMENTAVPLDIIFVSKDKKVLNIGAGKSFSKDSVPSTSDAMYVLELKAGQGPKLGFSPGTTIHFSKEVSFKSGQ